MIDAQRSPFLFVFDVKIDAHCFEFKYARALSYLYEYKINSRFACWFSQIHLGTLWTWYFDTRTGGKNPILSPSECV